MNVEIFKLRPDAVIPSYQTTGAAGFDFETLDEIIIEPNSIALIPTGLVIKTPQNYMLVISPRSSMPKKTGLRMPHSIGVIDSDYCGPADEVKIQVHNPTQTPIIIEKGQKIAQGIFVPVTQAQFVEIAENNNTTRGGFGSTGK
ncbi:dUTP diphosphatase [Candidatus Falkowbacteria bacterium]|nr:dUTP diphosphatase [Candidatus Falkowbacteria bacterium]